VVVWAVFTGLSCFGDRGPVKGVWEERPDVVEIVGEVLVRIVWDLPVGERVADVQGAGYSELLES
jgi:hypothetical protein